MPRLMLILVILVAVLPYIATAAGPEPTTVPSAAKDLSAPKAAAITFYRAMMAGDADLAKSAAVGNEEQMRAIDATCALSQGLQRLSEAVKEKFGQADPGLANQAAGLSVKLQGIEKMDVRLDGPDGDAATLTDPASKQTMQARKVRGEWRVAMDSMPGHERAGEVTALAAAVARAAEQLAAEIKQDKHRSAEEARQAFQSNLSAILSTRPTTTAPATRPTSEEP